MNVKPNLQTLNFHNNIDHTNDNWHFSADYDNNNNNSQLYQNFGQILAETWAIIGEFSNFSQIFKLLDVISDQFMDCSAIIDHYAHITVHKLDWNYI